MKTKKKTSWVLVSLVFFVVTGAVVIVMEYAALWKLATLVRR